MCLWTRLRDPPRFVPHSCPCCIALYVAATCPLQVALYSEKHLFNTIHACEQGVADLTRPPFQKPKYLDICLLFETLRRRAVPTREHSHEKTHKHASPVSLYSAPLRSTQTPLRTCL